MAPRSHKSSTSSLFIFIAAINCLIIVCNHLQIVSGAGSPHEQPRRATCTHELEAANRTLALWASSMRQMIAASSSSARTNDNSIAQEAALIQVLIANFGANLNKRPIERLVKDLVAIRRRANRMALDSYLKSHDTRWPHGSVQMGVMVERVQQACLSNLDRAAMLVLNPPQAFVKG